MIEGENKHFSLRSPIVNIGYDETRGELGIAYLNAPGTLDVRAQLEEFRPYVVEKSDVTTFIAVPTESKEALAKVLARLDAPHPNLAEGHHRFIADFAEQCGVKQLMELQKEFRSLNHATEIAQTINV